MRVDRFGLFFFPLLRLFETSSGQVSGVCVENIADIYTMESQVTDVSVHRTYIMCPRRIYEIGTLDFNFDVQGFQVQPPFPLRPNMSIKCGDTGSRDNLCWLAQGDVHVDATKILGIEDDTVENVSIEGFVFIGAKKYGVWATKPGDITFRDCEWRDFTQSVVPVLLDFFDGTDSQLSVTFENCWFHDNRFFGFGSNSALIYANSAQNSLTIRRTTFDDNDMMWNNTMSESNSFIIESLGPLTVENICFRNNKVGVSNAVVFGSQLIDSEVYVYNSTGTLCSFASVFENLQQFDQFTPLCVNALNTDCTAGESAEPTMSPKPTGGATIPPTFSPTLQPTETISRAPTGTPTPAPSARPSSPGDSPLPTVVTPNPTLTPSGDTPFPTGDTPFPTVVTPSPTLAPPNTQSSMAPFVWPPTEAPDGSAAPFRRSVTTVLVAFCFGLIRMLA